MEEKLLKLSQLFEGRERDIVLEMISEYSKQNLLKTDDIVNEVAWIASKRGPEFILSCTGLQEVFEKDLKTDIEKL